MRHLPQLHPAIRLALLFGVTACTRQADAHTVERAAVTLAGSTSIQPFAERWAEEYRGGRIIVQAGGSTAGIKAAHDGTADIGMASRTLSAAEATGLVQTVVARDGIAIIVHASNPVRTLTLAQLRAVYAGQIRNWRDLGGTDAAITVITREDGSGTRDAFEGFVMGRAREAQEIAASALVTAYSGGLRKMVSQDPAAIGYVTFSQLNPQVRALAVDGVLPTEASIASGTYRLQRPFVFLTRGAPDGAAREFISFVLSIAGQQLARSEGLAPVALQ
ncbi:MAG: phosphate ABC transporter substrate-binding protein [Gemmatimonadaceae bacterium]|nr:phosphate ABC transporter substrate-binding protein [Gemmatimonadaceae bacterium]